MKNVLKIAGIAVLLFSISLNASAQKKMKEGFVMYELTEVGSDDPMAQMMKGSRMSFFFDKKMQKFEMSMMGGMMEITNIADIKAEESTMLTNIMGQKSMVKMSKEDTQAQKEKNKKPDFTVTYDKNDKKEIVGYNCYKAVLETTDSVAVSIEMYVTDEISVELAFFKEMFPGLTGFPMEYSMGQAGMNMVFSAQELKTKLDAGTFDIPSTDEYPEMSMEDFQKQMGAMGGMGF